MRVSEVSRSKLSVFKMSDASDIKGAHLRNVETATGNVGNF